MPYHSHYHRKRSYHRSYSGGGYRPRRHRGRLRVGRLLLLILIFAAVIAGIVFGIMFLTKTGVFSTEDVARSADGSQSVSSFEPAYASAPADAAPAAADSTQPTAFGLSFEIEQDGNTVSSAVRAKDILFPSANDYSLLSGIALANGNNYRSAKSFGALSERAGSLETAWHEKTTSSSLQPLIVEWEADLRQMMELYPEKQNKDGLVEVLSLQDDGTLAFQDLSDGSPTRDALSLGSGSSFALDPRGYPLLYAGGGTEDPSIRIYSLLSGELLYRYDSQTDTFSPADTEKGFSCSPLVSADADTLVWAGNNGVLYTFVLNSDFDRAAGTVSVNPDSPVKYRYSISSGAENESYSITGLCAWRGYAFVTDSGGYLQCIDLNTMNPVYIQYLNGACAAAPLLEEEADGIYLYIGTSASNAAASLYKIKGLSGEIIWQREFSCGEAGGVLSTPVPGYGSLDGAELCTVSHADGSYSAVYSLADDTGEIKWEYQTGLAASDSPVPIYTPDGAAAVFLSAEGRAVLLDNSGTLLDSLDVPESTGAPAAVFGSTAVFGGTGILLG